MKKHLRYSIEAARLSQDFRHAQTVMNELGIIYGKAISQTVGDQWWFLDCDKVPVTLPPYITPMEMSADEYEHWTAP